MALLKKHLVLSPQTWLANCPEVYIKIPSGVSLTNVDTPSRNTVGSECICCSSHRTELLGGYAEALQRMFLEEATRSAAELFF